MRAHGFFWTRVASSVVALALGAACGERAAKEQSASSTSELHPIRGDSTEHVVTPAPPAPPAMAPDLPPAPQRQPVREKPRAAAPPQPAPPPPKSRVRVPRTDHVYATFPRKLQALLDEDPRMQPWLDKVVAIVDRCYAGARGDSDAGGTIVLQLTMHENARPDVDIESLPPRLSSVVACATGDLMRSRSPLFTSREGERYKVELHFVP